MRAWGGRGRGHETRRPHGHSGRRYRHEAGQGDTNDRKAHQDKSDIINVLIRYGEQDLSDYSLTQAMSDEYKRLVEEAKNARRG